MFQLDGIGGSDSIGSMRLFGFDHAPPWRSAPNKRQQMGWTEGVLDIVALVSYDKPKLHEITDYKQAYDTLCEQVNAIGRQIIFMDSEGKPQHDRIDDNPFSNDG
ncbi:MAG: hypothetical protein ABI690_25670 [Chloroflexota bacterium]